MAHKALQSLWGADGVEAIAKVRARECVAMPGLREQEILTPSSILDPLVEMWGEIACDPCGSRQHTFAKKTFYIEDDGLTQRWPDCTFVNPPYGKLKDWLQAAARNSEGRMCMLVPVRSHRRWWRAFARECSAILYLDPLKFVGYAQAFPAPLCLMFTEDVNLAPFLHLGSTLDAEAVDWP